MVFAMVAVMLATVARAANLVWAGGLNGNVWDVSLTTNWMNGATRAAFQPGDQVSFTDAGSANQPVLNTNVTPASVIFSSANNYTLNGTGSISGTTGLTKTNSGWLVVCTLNSYTGNTVISSGTLQLAANPPAAGLAALYALDGNGNDGSANGNNLTLVGSPGFLPGRFGEAISLNGSNQYGYSPAYPAAFQNLNSYSVSVWVNVSNAPASGKYSGLVSTRASGNDDTFDLQYNNAAAVPTIHSDIGSGTAWLTTAADYPLTLTPGTWYLITYVVNNPQQNVTIYLNGSAVTNYPIAGTPLFMKSAQVLNLGNLTFGSGTVPFNGRLDDVRLYNRALSATEVAAIFGGALPAASAVSITMGATLDVNGTSQKIGSLSDLGGGGGLVTNSAPMPCTLTLNPATSPGTFSGIIADHRNGSATNAVALAVNGSGGGTQILNGTNTYSGSTVVNSGTLVVNGEIGAGNAASAVTVTGGTLAGSGTINAPVTINSGAVIAPGVSNVPGTLALTGSFTLAGSVQIVVNKSLAPSNSLITVSGTPVNLGVGSVLVSNTGPALVQGDSFQLFNQPLAYGAALTITPAPGAGLFWTNRLMIDGSIAVVTNLASSSTNPITNVSQGLYLQCLTNFETYGESIWHEAAYSGAPPDAGYWGDGSTTGNGGIRGNAGCALAYAVLVIAQPGSPNNSNRLAHIRQALNYNAGTHSSGSYVAVNGAHWGWNVGTLADDPCSESGSDWQVSLWAAPTAFAGFLVQSNLPANTIAQVQTMTISEANHRASVPPCSGFVGDTKAEETGWDGNVLAAAAAWMTNNASASNWLYALKVYLANTYTVANTTGDPLASWVDTINAYPDWAIENHGFFHPEYAMVAGEEMGDSWLMTRWMNPGMATQILPFAQHNVLAEWTSLQRCVKDIGPMEYPAGEDWAINTYGENSYLAYLAAQLNDPLARFGDANECQLERYHQILNTNGAFVGASGGGFYREAVQAYRTGMAWLQWQVASYPTGALTAPPASFAWLPDVAIIVQRNTNYYFSISYGPQTNGSPSKIMAIMNVPALSVPTNAYFATPRCPGILGLGALGSPTTAGLVSLATNASGFTAELTLTNGASGTTEVYLNSTGDKVAIVEVPWVATGVTGSAAASFTMGIENDPLSGGTRRLQWAGNAVTITNLGGVEQNATNNWVCVDGRYGVAAGPGGYFQYQAASGYTRVNTPGALNESGAAEDTLSFVPANSLGPRYAVWFPGQSPAQSSNLAAQIGWTVSGTNATLTFPGLGGAPTQISAVVPIPPPLPPYVLAISNVTASSSQSGYPPTNAVDGNYSDFWVSSGSSPGQGPTTNHPEWLFVTFPREVAVSEFQVVPRVAYGPQNVQIWLNGAAIYSGAMTSTGTLTLTLSPPLYATNAELYITSSYDPAYPTNSRNVQVVEMTFFERALPGTYEDWQLHYFTDAQLANTVISGPTADPDGDGVPNLLEFAAGGNPLAPDATNAMVRGLWLLANQFAFQFQERASLGNVSRQFQSSGDLINWTNTTPAAVKALQNFGGSSLYQALFPVQPAPQFFRIQYSLTN